MVVLSKPIKMGLTPVLPGCPGIAIPWSEAAPEILRGSRNYHSE
ncbi:hypothetical protein S1OALGB6SA_1492 [Olavius algarvensis spirochete endosymbiont]|nr:hypothetical protein S1OALGB6SA_1492 [Olavius algarvensis spirochete endosymbiont]